MDKEEYQQKLRTLLKDGPYIQVKRDPGPGIRRNLHRLLMSAVSDGRLSRMDLLRLCPTHYQTPHIYGLPKIHKPHVPLRPIVSLRDSVLAPVSRLLADIMAPFVKQCDSYIRDSEDLVSKLSEQCFTPGYFASVDVVSLFTNVPIPETLQVFKQLLLEDSSLCERTCFSVNEIIILSEFVLTSCYFVHYDGLFVQTSGATMGSSLGPVAANIFMSHFEKCVLQEAPRRSLKTPSLWLRYVDDVLLYWTHDEADMSSFLDFLNNFRPSIKFNLESETDGELPFLDVLIRYKDGQLSFVCIGSRRTRTSTYAGTPLILEVCSRASSVPWEQEQNESAQKKQRHKNAGIFERYSGGMDTRRMKLNAAFKHVTTTTRRRPSLQKRKGTHYPTSPAHQSVLPRFYTRWGSLPPCGRSRQSVRCSCGNDQKSHAFTVPFTTYRAPTALGTTWARPDALWRSDGRSTSAP